MRVLFVNWGAADDAELEHRLFPDVTFDLFRGVSGQERYADACRAADAVINCSATETLHAEPAAFPRCRIAIRSGVGFDNLDIPGWSARGVPVCNVPDYGTTEVADHAIALMLALTRGTATYHDALRNDPGGAGWSFAAAPLVRRLRGAIFGVLGLGRIGLAAANRAAGFGMRVVFHDPYLPSGTELAVGFERVHGLQELLARSDVLSVHAPLSGETRGLLGREALAAAKPGLILVNTARGPIVDLDAVHEALRDGPLGGAALDVLPREPADPEHPLIAAWRAREPWLEGRLTLTPHAAFYSPAAFEDLRRKSVEVAVAYLREGRLTNCVNAAALKPA